MALLERLRVFLDENRSEYTHTTHPVAFTAREVASAEHLPPREVAKCVVISSDVGYHLVVVPASFLVDFQELRMALGMAHARLATEQELNQLFPDCELGAMPPFGNLYGLPVYLDSRMAAEHMIAFNAGTHRDVVHMRTNDYRNLVQPTLVCVTHQPAVRGAW